MECLPVVYGLVTRSWILSGDPGNERIQEIAHAIQQGASAYLTRQYRIIGIVGFVLFVIIIFLPDLEFMTVIGFLVGAVLSGACGFIGMNVSVRVNKCPYGTGCVKWHAERTGCRVQSWCHYRYAGCGGRAFGCRGFYLVRTYLPLGTGLSPHNHVWPLVGLAFGASLISIFVRLGGRIFIKGVDVGADIPEDDPRNPAAHDMVTRPSALIVIENDCSAVNCTEKSK